VKSAKPILVTGSHRSGTTWTGQMLAAAPHTAYVHEPFNSELRLGLSPSSFEQTFKYISESESEEYQRWFKRVLAFHYPLLRNFTRSRSVDDLLKLINKQSYYWGHKLRKNRPIVKDPIAIFSAEWIHGHFDTDVLVMIRNPNSFCSSLKIKNWNFNFGYFLEQPLLMERYLSRYAQEIGEYATTRKPVIEQASLLWNCIHATILTLQQNHPDWLFIKHEELSLEPLAQFKAIYQAFDLEFTAEVEAKILQSSGAHNPVEQQQDNEFVRDSKQNIDNWKKRLSAEEIALIETRTAEISTVLYPGKSWSAAATDES